MGSVIPDEGATVASLTEEQSREMFPLAWAWNDMVQLCSRDAQWDLFARAETLTLTKTVDEAAVIRAAAATAVRNAAQRVIDIAEGEPITEEGKQYLKSVSKT